MTELTKLPHCAAPNAVEDDWAGFLTVENVGHIAAAVRRLLAGRVFSIAESYEYRDWRVELDQTGEGGSCEELRGDNWLGRLLVLVRAELDCEVRS